MQCPKCQHDNRQEAIFCERCGSKLQLICPDCGNELRLEAVFCDKCGAKVAESVPTAPPKLEDMQKQLQDRIPQSLADKLFAGAQQMQGEYRLVTALFADVSGSSGMAREMPLEQYVETMNDCFKIMVDTISIKYEGSINRFIGDCVLAFFGAPITHENDAERAILAALDIRDSVEQMNLGVSIGINTGMTYVGEMGSDLIYSERSAWGPDVDFGKRLQEAAEPGQILVGASTYRVTSRAFDFARPMDIEAKGMEKLQVAYPVLHIREHPEKLRGIEGLRARMIGREREFADLKDSVNELLSGRGQIVSITGEAGVGKSRLVRELREYLRGRGGEGASVSVSILEGRCVSIGESIGYWVFTDMLRGYLEFSEDGSLAQRQEKIVGKMKSLFPQRWEEIVPYVGNFLSVEVKEWDDKIRYFSPEQVKQQTFFTLRDLFFAMAQQRPLLLIFEDLHWADNLSLDMINLLMDDLTRSALMLLCVYRPYKEHRSWHVSAQASAKCLDRYREITLRPLNPQESRRLVGALLDIENLPESVRESILEKAEGNPFFVEEVIRSLIESGVVYQDGERWVATDDVGDLAVPDTIQSVIMARIDRLQDEVKYVLQNASVIGRLFRHKLLGYITQQEQNLDSYLWQLEERDLVYEERAIPELEYSFRHVLTQETAYNTILTRRRREFHRRVAQGYEALYSSRLGEYYEELAYHYSRSDDRQKALDYLVKAGDKSKEAFANEEAIEYYNQALKLSDDADVQPALLGHIYQGLGEIHFALEVKLKPASHDLRSRGGLLIWKDKGNYIQFEMGRCIEDGIWLSGVIQGSFACFGRGILRSDALYLRLERIGSRYSAYCSGDGMSWYTCGEVDFAVEDPVHVGLCAVGLIDVRSLEVVRTATRFDYFRILKRTS